MANQYDIIPGTFENVTGESIGSLVLDEESKFKLDGNYPFLLSNITLKQGSTTIPPSSYTLHQDDDATTQEVGKTDATLYGAITITDATYAGVELNVTGQNFGTYASNQGTQDFVNEEVTTLSNTLTPRIDELYLKGIPEYDPAEGYLADVSFVQDEGMIWVSNEGTVGVPNVGNKPSTNQDKWNPVKAPEIVESVSDSGTYTPVYKNAQLVLDTALGDASHTVGDPKFLGQEITLSNEGTGFATFNNANDFSYGIIVDTEHNPVIKAVDDGVGVLKWEVGSQVSADYVDVDSHKNTLYTSRKYIIDSIFYTGISAQLIGFDRTFLSGYNAYPAINTNTGRYASVTKDSTNSATLYGWTSFGTSGGIDGSVLFIGEYS